MVSSCADQRAYSSFPSPPHDAVALRQQPAAVGAAEAAGLLLLCAQSSGHAFSSAELTSLDGASLPASSSATERLWYDVQWNNEQRQFGSDVSSLFADNIYVCVVLGYSSLAFVIGALSF